MVLLQSSGQDQTAVGLGHPQAALSNRGPSTEWGSGSDSRLGAGIGLADLKFRSEHHLCSGSRRDTVFSVKPFTSVSI